MFGLCSILQQADTTMKWSPYRSLHGISADTRRFKRSPRKWRDLSFCRKSLWNTNLFVILHLVPKMHQMIYIGVFVLLVLLQFFLLPATKTIVKTKLLRHSDTCAKTVGRIYTHAEYISNHHFCYEHWPTFLAWRCGRLGDPESLTTRAHSQYLIPKVDKKVFS